MLNAFTHYDFSAEGHGLPRSSHFSNNRVDQQLTQSNIGGDFLFNANNPYLDASMRDVARAARSRPRPDRERCSRVRSPTRPRRMTASRSSRRAGASSSCRSATTSTTTTSGAPRSALRGDLGDVSDNFLRNLTYDVYYSFARSEDSSRQEGAASRSRYARPHCCRPTARRRSRTSSARTCRRRRSTPSTINSTNVTNAEQQVAAATLRRRSVRTAGRSGRLLGRRRMAHGGGGIHSRTSSCDRAMWSASIPACRRAATSRRRTFSREVRVPILADIPACRTSPSNGGFRSSDYDLDGVGRVSTYLYGLDWRVNETLVSFARSSSARSARRTSAICTAGCSSTSRR